LHIAIDARRINTSTGRYIERLLHHLQDLDASNDYTVLMPEQDLDYWRPTAKNFRVVPSDFEIYSLAEQSGFLRQLNEVKADLVHFPMPQQPVLYRGKHVTTFHDLTLLNTYNSDKNWFVYRAKQAVGRFAFRHGLSSSSHILTGTEFTKNALIEFAGTKASKISVTPYAAEAPESWETSGSATAGGLPFARFLLYVGQQPDYKNIRRLGDAHQQLLETDPELGLVLAGRMNPAAQRNSDYFAERGYKNIHFTGYISDETLDDYYRHASAYVFPSLMEGFGLPGLEAMQRHLPVVSSNATCLPEVYGDAAEYFDPLEVDDIASAIRRVIENESRQKELVELGLQRARQFSWRRMAEQTLAIYRQALAIA
jgi:glycosyltransferase involved in cell wall biosynthesis